MITTSGSLMNMTGGGYAFELGVNVSLMSETFVSIVTAHLFLNGSLIGSSTENHVLVVEFNN